MSTHRKHSVVGRAAQVALIEMMEQRTMLSAAPIIPDAGFGAAGVAYGSAWSSTVNGPVFNSAEAVAQLPNGQIVIAGDVTFAGTYAGTSGVYLREINSDGSVDNAFATDQGHAGANGYVFLTVPSGISAPTPTVVGLRSADSADNIYLAQTGVGILRFNVSGTLDTSFGTGGTFADTQISGFTIASNGQIFVATGASKLTRLTANGKVDTSFGPAGTVTLPSAFIQAGSVVAIQQDGKIVVGGTFADAATDSTDLGAVRLNTNGQIDSTFGTRGVAIANSLPEEQGTGIQSYSSHAAGIDVLTNGDIVVGGSGGLSGHAAFVFGATLAEFLPSGQLNTSFGPGGQTPAFAPPGTGGEFLAVGFITQADGTHIIVLTNDTPMPFSNTSYHLVRYTAAGTVDSVQTEEVDTTTTDYGVSPTNNAHDAVAGLNGTVVVAGEYGDGNPDYAFLARYLTDAPDGIQPMAGTVIGSGGSYDRNNNVGAKAFDGNLATFYDAAHATGDWTGLDLGLPRQVTQISYAPRSGFASRMAGGVFQASDTPDFSSDVVTLYTITSTPAAGMLTTVAVSNTSLYRYVRYLGPASSYCNIAEAQFSGPPVFLQEGPTGAVVVTGSSGADRITVNFSSDQTDSQTTGNFTVTVNGITQTLTAANPNELAIISSDGNDNVTVSGSEQSEATAPEAMGVGVIAGSGNDTIGVFLTDSGFTGDLSYLSGGAYSYVDAGDGNDVISVQGGVSTGIDVGNGNDSLTSVAGADQLHAAFSAGDGNDTLTAGSAGDAGQVDTMTAGTGRDRFVNTDVDDNVSLYVGGSDEFGLTYNQAAITGVVFVDSNGDGLYQTGEPPLPNVQLYLDANNNGQFDSGEMTATTDQNGVYIFGGLNPDVDQATTSYIVRLLMLPGNTLLLAPPGGSYSVDLSPGVARSGFDFALTLPTSGQLTGTPIGSAGSYGGKGNVAANAFDGNLNTYFDAKQASGDWTGLDLGRPQLITQISYAPRAGWASRMVGGMFQVSSDPDFKIDVHTIYTVTTAPAAGQFTTVNITDPGAYEYVRYIGPANSYCNVAEAEFFSSPEKLAGTPIGTAGSYNNQGNTIANVFDGNLSTFFDAPTPSGAWVGLDLGAPQIVTQVSFAPRDSNWSGFAKRMIGGEIQASNTADFSSGVVTVYTITSAPPVEQLTTVTLPVVGAYQYWRYLGPDGGSCNIAELAFIG